MLREALLRENSDYGRVEYVLGPRVALQLARFRDGSRYVRAGEWMRFKAWAVDLAVVLVGVGVGALLLAVVNRTADFDSATMVLLVVLMLPVVSLLYGVWYGDGRALGAVLTGTRLVRKADGGRIGAKGPWVMLVRIVLLPLGAVFLVAAALGGSGGWSGGDLIRVSVDVDAVRRLAAAGITD
jgi:hypothetical protein